MPESVIRRTSIMAVRIRYTRNGTRYADYSKATVLEELELYKQLAPKDGFVRYSPHPRGLRPASTDPSSSAASSGSSQAVAGPAAAAEQAGQKDKGQP
jgi:hypothetical protein